MKNAWASDSPQSVAQQDVRMNDLLHRILDCAPEAIIVLDSQGDILVWNPHAEALFGRTAGEMAGQQFPDLFPVEMRKPLTDCIEKSLQGITLENIEVTYAKSLSRNIDLIINSSLFKEGNEPRILLLVRNWSRKKKEIEKVHAQNLELSESLGELGVEHIRLKEANRELEILTIFDELTRLYNRRYFFHRARTEFARALRYRQPMAVLLLDLDHFKQVNDENGHLFGDAVLRDSGMLILGAIRTTDIPARYGGEEFIILAPETPAEGAYTIGERLRKCYEEYVFSFEEQSRHVTISIGACAIPPYRFADLDEMIRQADEALYRAKETRNQVVCYRTADE